MCYGRLFLKKTLQKLCIVNFIITVQPCRIHCRTVQIFLCTLTLVYNKGERESKLSIYIKVYITTFRIIIPEVVLSLTK